MALPSLLFIHGAANAAWVWDFWLAELRGRGWQANVLDLRGHGLSMPTDFATVMMEDYVSDVESVTQQIAAAEGQHPLVVGWSMGGLVAMMYAAKHPETPALVLLASSPPEEVGGRGSRAEVDKTPDETYGPEVYGIDGDDREATRLALADLTEAEVDVVIEKSKGALESGIARRQRRRGIKLPVGSIDCPALVIYGEEDRQFAPELQRQLAVYLNAPALAAPAAGHWGLVYSARTVSALAGPVSDWLHTELGEG